MHVAGLAFFQSAPAAGSSYLGVIIVAAMVVLAVVIGFMLAYALFWRRLDQVPRDLARIVGASVVDDDQFPYEQRLRQHALDGLGQMAAVVVTRDDHRDAERRQVEGAGSIHGRGYRRAAGRLESGQGSRATTD